MAITSLDQVIDIGAVKAGCTVILNAKDELSAAKQYIAEAISTSGPNVCSVPGTEAYSTMIAELENSLRFIGNFSNGLADAIASQAERIYKKQMDEYNSYMEMLAKMKEKLENRRDGGN